MAREDQVRRGRDGKELGDALHDAEQRSTEGVERRRGELGEESGVHGCPDRVRVLFVVGTEAITERVDVKGLVLGDHLSSENRSRASAAARVDIDCQRASSVSIRIAARGHALDVADRAQRARLAVAHDLGQPAGVASPRPARRCASASSALRPNDSLCDGRRKRSALARSGATASSLPRKNTRSCTPSRRASCSASMRPDHRRPSRARSAPRVATRAKMRDDVAHALHRPEVRDVHAAPCAPVHLIAAAAARSAPVVDARDRRSSG